MPFQLGSLLVGEDFEVLDLPGTLDLREVLLILGLLFGFLADRVDLVLEVLELQFEDLGKGHGLEVDLPDVLPSLLHDLLPVALLDRRDL